MYIEVTILLVACWMPINADNNMASLLVLLKKKTKIIYKLFNKIIYNFEILRYISKSSFFTLKCIKLVTHEKSDSI